MPIQAKETSSNAPAGWKYLEVWLALENASQQWLAFPDGSFSAADIYLTTAEGYRYPLEGSWEWSEAGTFRSNWISTGGAILPPGFRVRGLADIRGLERSVRVNHLLFEVAESTTRYQVHLPGYDPFDLDNDTVALSYPLGKQEGQFHLGAAIPVRDKGIVNPRSCQLRVSEVWPSQIRLVVSFANASGGYDQTFQLTGWVVGNDGILRPESARTKLDGAEMPLGSVTVGPGQVLEVLSTFYASASADDFKLLLTGDVQAAYDLDCERVVAGTAEGLAHTIPWLPEDDDYGGCTWYYSFNLTQPPFDNTLVRQAFALALDREVLVGESELHRPATTFIPYRILGRDLYKSVGWAYDPAEARRRLAEAGYPDGQGFPLVTLLVPGNPSNPPADRDLAVVQMWYDTLGVMINIEQESNFNTYLSRIRGESGKIWRLAWCADFNDPDNFVSVFQSWDTNNRCGFANATFDDLVRQARANAADPLYRQELYVEAESILCQYAAAVIPVYHTK